MDSRKLNPNSGVNLLGFSAKGCPLPLSPFFGWEGFPKIDKTEKSWHQLILVSRLEDLVVSTPGYPLNGDAYIGSICWG